MSSPVAMAMIGCGGMARHHMRNILKQLDTTRVTVVCEPSPEAYAAFAKIFTDAGQTAPPNETDLGQLLARHKVQTAFIVTPHAFHHDQTQFLRADLVEEGWAIVDPVLDAWGNDHLTDFPNYQAGTWGPEAATRLIAVDGRSWSNPNLGEDEEKAAS